MLNTQAMSESQKPEIEIIGCQEVETIPGLFLRRAARLPSEIAYSEFDGRAWRAVTWADMVRRVNSMRAALDRAGLEPGDRAAILLPNCVDWIAFDIAAMANGLITVPLYFHDGTPNICFILSNSGARICLIDSVERLPTLAPHLKSLAALEHVWIHRGSEAPPDIDGIRVSHLSELLDVEHDDSAPVRCRGEDIATLIHTSGTTGLPKGAMLSHHALLWNAEAVTKFIPPRTSDVFLSLLPLAHAFERTMGYHLAMMGGAQVAFARSIATLREDMLVVRPTILVAVPRLYERLYEAILRKAERNPIKRHLAQLAAATGWRRFEAQHGRAPSLPLAVRALLWPLLARLVARPVLRAFGGRLRVAVSGGAPLSTEVSHFLIGLGLPLVEGYGLTEAAPVVTATTLEDNAPGSVGRMLSGVEARLGAENELLIRSPALMRGYWNDPDRSAAAIDTDGWLHTGDIAEIREGRLYITGRLKDLIVLSTGKKVASSAVEAAIEAAPLFDQCCAIGDARPFVSALVVLDGRRWTAFAEQNGLDPANPNAVTAKQAILARINRTMVNQPAFAQVRDIHVLLQPWTTEDGSLTPTLKIKRRVVQERFRAEIEALYARKAS